MYAKIMSMPLKGVVQSFNSSKCLTTINVQLQLSNENQMNSSLRKKTYLRLIYCGTKEFSMQ